MKRNLLIGVTVAMTALMTADLSSLHAQPPPSSAAPPAPGTSAPPVPGNPPAAGTAPAPGMPPVPRVPRRMAPGMVFQRAIMYLRQSKTQLQRAEGDLNGHKQSAMDACDKAIEELDAALKAVAPPPQAAPAPQPAPPAQ